MSKEATYAYVPSDMLDDILYKTTCYAVEQVKCVEELNKKVAELVDKLADVSTKNKVLEEENTELRRALEEARNDGTF